MAAFTGWAAQQKGIVLDWFAGPGGWSEGLRQFLGLHDVGLEWDQAACETRAAAGHTTIRVDVSSFVLTPLIGRVWGAIFSPPCTKFSTAGNGLGRKFIPLLADGIRRVLRGEDCRQEIRDRIYPVALAARQEDNDARKEGKRWSQARVEAAALEDTIATVLVLEPARCLYALICGRGDGGVPLEWVAFEQVPSVLPLWEVYAEELRRLGWSVWTGKLNAANYGVPQTRERAVLIGSSVRKVAPPEPTHAQVSQPDLFGPGLPKWVSMAQALGLEGNETINTRGDRKTPGGNEFPTDRPSWALTEKTRSWTLHTNRDQRPDGSRQTVDPHSAPAPALTSKSGGQWVLRSGQSVGGEGRAERRLDQPSVAMTGRADLCSWSDGETKRPIAQDEASVLQSFPGDYPWQGTRTKQFEQVGNAVPPLLAAHVASAASGVPFLKEALAQAA
jgi:DNA (cytosine-5)-methyltransferase 1